MASGDKAEYSRLEAHLNRYTARNTFDYFIHKDLGTFLRRELDFYIKNEVMYLDDVENESAYRASNSTFLRSKSSVGLLAGSLTFSPNLRTFQKEAVAEEEVRGRDPVLHHGW